MPDRTYRIGIVGASEITSGLPQPGPTLPIRNEVVTIHAPSLALMPNVELVGVCDIFPDLAKVFRERWSHRWPEIGLYSDHTEMLDTQDLDILTVATSDHAHADITVDAANTGVRGILCEKPIATSLADADRMIEACGSNGVVLAVDHTRRWSVLYHEVREAIRSGAIGPVGTIFATLGGKRAMLFRNGTHLIEAMCFFAESDPMKVSAVLEEGFDSWDRYRGGGGRDASSEPGASGFVQFANGVRGLYCGTKGTFSGWWLQISGPKGQVHVDILENWAQLMTGDVLGEGGQRRNLIPRPFQVQGLVAAYQEISDLIENGGESVSSAREARKTLQVMVGFLKSNQEGGRLVTVPESD